VEKVQNNQVHLPMFMKKTIQWPDTAIAKITQKTKVLGQSKNINEKAG
jgi:hypothetical protein